MAKRRVVKSLGKSLFISNIKRLMVEHGMNQRLVAYALGLDPSTITWWVTGRSSPSLLNITAVASLFGVKHVDLFKGE